eukprot:1044566-Rhodomonas_salina.1
MWIYPVDSTDIVGEVTTDESSLMCEIARKRMAMGWAMDNTTPSCDNSFRYSHAIQELMHQRKHHEQMRTIQCGAVPGAATQEEDEDQADAAPQPRKKEIQHVSLIKPQDSDDDFQPLKPMMKVKAHFSLFLAAH